MRALLLVLSLLSLSCASVAPAPPLWTELQSLCGRAFEGRMIEGTAPGDAEIGAQRLVMHVRSCTANEIRMPFHVGENRSRTWVLTRKSAGGLRLKHDHRHEDGSEDAVTQYGGDAVTFDTRSVDFPADAHTARMLPVSATNIWTVAVDPGRTFTYALRREGRRFRVEFDLTRPVAAPPPPWE